MKGTNNLKEDVTAGRLVVKGMSGKSYDFSVRMLEGGVHAVQEEFDGCPGVVILAECAAGVGTERDDYNFLYLGIADNIKERLSEGVIDAIDYCSRINCVCYLCEPVDLVRSDVGKDIAAANRFLYISGLDGAQPYCGAERRKL